MEELGYFQAFDYKATNTGVIYTLYKAWIYSRAEICFKALT